jgi:hypothetical protein
MVEAAEAARVGFVAWLKLLREGDVAFAALRGIGRWDHDAARSDHIHSSPISRRLSGHRVSNLRVAVTRAPNRADGGRHHRAGRIDGGETVTARDSGPNNDAAPERGLTKRLWTSWPGDVRNWLHFSLPGSRECRQAAAFATFGKLQTGALLVTLGPFFDSRREWIMALASSNAVPAIYGFRELAVAGGLISYGASFTTVCRQIGIYAGKILGGAKPV